MGSGMKDTPRTPGSLIRNVKGQMLVEYVLILSLVVALSTLLFRGLSAYELPKKITVEPWARLDSMIQCGTWSVCGINPKPISGPSPGPVNAHPHTVNRLISLDPRTK